MNGIQRIRIALPAYFALYEPAIREAVEARYPRAAVEVADRGASGLSVEASGFDDGATLEQNARELAERTGLVAAFLASLRRSVRDPVVDHAAPDGGAIRITWHLPTDAPGMRNVAWLRQYPWAPERGRLYRATTDGGAEVTEFTLPAGPASIGIRLPLAWGPHAERIRHDIALRYRDVKLDVRVDRAIVRDAEVVTDGFADNAAVGAAVSAVLRRSLSAPAPDPSTPASPTAGLSRAFEFTSYGAALDFVQRLGALAEKRRHHPDIALAHTPPKRPARRGGGIVTVTWRTHDAGAVVTEKDRQMMALAEDLARRATPSSAKATKAEKTYAVEWINPDTRTWATYQYGLSHARAEKLARTLADVYSPRWFGRNVQTRVGRMSAVAADLVREALHRHEQLGLARIPDTVRALRDERGFAVEAIHRELLRLDDAGEIRASPRGGDRVSVARGRGPLPAGPEGHGALVRAVQMRGRPAAR